MLSSKIPVNYRVTQKSLSDLAFQLILESIFCTRLQIPLLLENFLQYQNNCYQSIFWLDRFDLHSLQDLKNPSKAIHKFFWPYTCVRKDLLHQFLFSSLSCKPPPISVSLCSYPLLLIIGIKISVINLMPIRKFHIN